MPGAYNGFTRAQRARGGAIVHQAWATGALPRPTVCEACGSTRNVGGHNEDYSQPLRYYELCWRCHTRLHRRYRNPAAWRAYLATLPPSFLHALPLAPTGAAPALPPPARLRGAAPQGFTPQAFVRRSRWRAATSREYQHPNLRHAYTVRGKTADRAWFDAMAAHIAAHGYRHRFGRWTNTYLDVGDHRYWHMGRVINRCPVDAPWEDPRQR